MSLPFLADIEDDYFSDAYGHYTDEELEESPAERKARLAAERRVPKGHCRKCGAHVGRGVAFHEKACNG